MALDLPLLVRAQRRGCAIGGSPLYTSVLDAVAVDVEAHGPCHDVLSPFADEPRSGAVVLRLLAAVHEMVLEGRLPDLAAHYPSAGGRPGEDLDATFVAAVAEHRDEVVERTAAPIQTNEVGRSAVLVGGFTLLTATGLPLRVLEVGASAGLNLWFDRWRYEAGGEALGPADAPVRFVEPWEGDRPRLDVAWHVAERRGCDLHPLDPASPADRLRLRACLWPDQSERRARLDGALEVAADSPAPVDRADAAEWVADHLRRPMPGVVTVVVHTIVDQYLSPETRAALDAAVAAAGARATPEAPVARLCMEPASEREAELRVTLWPRPTPVRTHVLARSGFHGPPIRWG